MNRFLLVPFVAACAGFAGLVFVNSEPSSTATTSNTSIDTGDVNRLLAAPVIEEMLLVQWDESVPKRYSFSRSLRPTDRYQRPEILVDNDCPVADETFVGSIRLQLVGIPMDDDSTRQEYPIVVDRKTGQTVVYSENRWVSFEAWSLTRSL